jgi:AhpD family alkylhydroperoxidase
MPIGDIELKELRKDMGFSPALLKLIYESHPKMFDVIYNMDKALLSDGALPAKTKRLIALAVVSAMGCEACATAQMQAAMNMGASREEVLDTLACQLSRQLVKHSISVANFLKKTGAESRQAALASSHVNTRCLMYLSLSTSSKYLIRCPSGG